MRGNLLYFPFELGAFVPPYLFERMRCHCSVMRVPVKEIVRSVVNFQKSPYTWNTRPKLKVHETFRRCLGRVQCAKGKNFPIFVNEISVDDKLSIDEKHTR